jgi:hypothetical protein
MIRLSVKCEMQSVSATCYVPCVSAKCSLVLRCKTISKSLFKHVGKRNIPIHKTSHLVMRTRARIASMSCISVLNQRYRYDCSYVLTLATVISAWELHNVLASILDGVRKSSFSKDTECTHCNHSVPAMEGGPQGCSMQIRAWDKPSCTNWFVKDRMPSSL